LCGSVLSDTAVVIAGRTKSPCIGTRLAPRRHFVITVELGAEVGATRPRRPQNRDPSAGCGNVRVGPAGARRTKDLCDKKIAGHYARRSVDDQRA
jgi:hypothetical protein